MACRTFGCEGASWFFGSLLAVLALPAGAQTMSFVDVSEQAGIRMAGVAHGVAVHDYDEDGWDDIFITTLNGGSRLFRNNGDATFTDVTAESGLDGIGAYAVALWGDIDNDGLTDLFLGRAASGRSRLFRNIGDGQFEDISEASGIDRDASIATAAFGDVDGDGAVDLFLAIHNRADLLYRNVNGEPGAIFEDVSTVAGIGGPAHAVPMQATWADYDRDGDLDLFCVHDGRLASRLYRNDGSWPLRDMAFASRIHSYPDTYTCCNMGAAWGDFDGDGLPDVYVTRIGKGGLFRNNGDGTFTDEAEERGAARNGMSWGVVWLDADNDGDLDLFIVSTSGYDGTPTLLYENAGGTFAEIGRNAGASFRIDARGLATGDFNGDGLMDLVIGSTDGRNRLLLNATDGGGHWVKFKLRGRGINVGAVGIRLEVVAAGNTYVRTVSGGDSYASQSSSTVHVGLGGASRIDTLRVVWGGNRVEVLTDLAVDTTHVVAEGFATHARPSHESAHGDPALVAIYPNPVSEQMHVKLMVAKSGPVRVDLLDALGRKVAVLVDRFHDVGAYDELIDLSGVSSGVYLIRAESRGRVTVRLVVILP